MDNSTTKLGRHIFIICSINTSKILYIMLYINNFLILNNNKPKICCTSIVYFKHPSKATIVHRNLYQAHVHEAVCLIYCAFAIYLVHISFFLLIRNYQSWGQDQIKITFHSINILKLDLQQIPCSYKILQN